MYFLTRSNACNIIQLIATVSQSFQFPLFYLNTKNYLWYIATVKFHLVLCQRKRFRTPGIDQCNTDFRSNARFV
jgi:hypothetical protein